MSELFIREYEKMNGFNSRDEILYDECLFSYIDILKEKEVEVYAKKVVSCKCTSSVNFNTYYDKCDKCKGTGKINLNDNEVKCNHCKGTGKVIKNECPLCKGEGKVIKKGKVTVKLRKDLKEGDLIKQDNLVIKVKIKDLECFEIKGNDVYDRRIICFNKEEVSKKVSKSVETIEDIVWVKSSGDKVEEVVRLEGKGLNGGDYYVCLRSELTPLKGKDAYKNVIISRDKLNFYVKVKEIESDKLCLNTYYYKKVNDSDEYEYLSLSDVYNFKIVKLKDKGLRGKNGGSNGDLYLRVFFDDEFKNIDDKLYYKPVLLSKYEISDGKKVLEFAKTRINLSFMKNIDKEEVIKVKDYGFMKGKDEFLDLYVTLNPYGMEVYKVSVKVNKKDKIVYLGDYKYYFYEEVKVKKDGLKVLLSKKSDNVEVSDGNNKVIVRVLRG